MDIEKCSVVELKALVYDELVKMEQAKQNLAILNARIRDITYQPKCERTDGSDQTNCS